MKPIVLRGTVRALAAAVLLPLFLAGCWPFSSSEPYVIPEWDTAREQFRQAEGSRADAGKLFDKEAKAMKLDETVVAYRKVGDRFPTDEEYTPISHIRIADIYAELKHHSDAAAEYDYCLRTYTNPKYDDIRASAAFGKGVALDSQDKPNEAQQYYKMIIDEFSDDPRFRELVSRARSRYSKIR